LKKLENILKKLFTNPIALVILETTITNNPKRKDKTMQLYGTENETFAVAAGRTFIIQSTDLELDYEEISALPEDARPLSAHLTWDIEIPEEITRIEAAASMGRKGGKAKTPAKAAACRRNGKKGGRPKKITSHR